MRNKVKYMCIAVRSRTMGTRCVNDQSSINLFDVKYFFLDRHDNGKFLKLFKLEIVITL